MIEETMNFDIESLLECEKFLSDDPKASVTEKNSTGSTRISAKCTPSKGSQGYSQIYGENSQMTLFGS